MAQVWEHSAEKGEGLLVLLALADFANDDGLAYPSIESLMAKARCSMRGVQTIIKRLRDSGWLEVIPGGGRNHTNLYIIRVPKETPQVDAETPQVATPPTTETPHLVGSQMPETPQVDALNPAFSGQPNAPDPSGTIRQPSRDHPSGTVTAGARGKPSKTPKQPKPQRILTLRETFTAEACAKYPQWPPEKVERLIDDAVNYYLPEMQRGKYADLNKCVWNNLANRAEKEAANGATERHHQAPATNGNGPHRRPASRAGTREDWAGFGA